MSTCKGPRIFSVLFRAALVCAVMAASGLVFPRTALAIQTHGPMEGLVVHQIGHLLYGLAMLGFALRIRRSHLAPRRSWRLMSAGALLLAVWNVWAFIAHLLNRMIPSSHFLVSSTGLRTGLTIHSPVDWLYYLFKMDHLVSVPALVVVYLALTAMNSELNIQKDHQ